MKYFTKKDILLILISIVFIVGQVYLDLALPDYMSDITKITQTAGSTVEDIMSAGSKMVFCAVGSLTLTFIVGFFAAKLSAGLSKQLRQRVFDRVQEFSLEEINNFSTSSLVNRTTNDITQVQLIVAMGLQVVVKAPILAVLAIIKIANKSWEWTAATGVAVALLLCLISTIVFVAVPRFRKIQTFNDNLSRITRENLTGIRVVRAYSAEQYQNDKFDVANSAMNNNALTARRAMAIMQPGMTFISNSLNLAIYCIGAIMISQAGAVDKLTIFSDMVVFVSYAMQIIMAFMMMTMILIQFPRAQVSANRIMEVLETQATIKSGDKEDGVTKGEVEFRNVTFAYPDASEPVLSNVSFKATLGQTIAIIGSAGSGKSTLVNLICRFYDVTEGEILVDGINVKDYQLENLHKKIGYVPQKAVMFKGTVEENVSYGSRLKGDVSDAELANAIQVAQAEEFVSKLDKKTGSFIAQGGTNLSGGQKQRLSIARAIARDPELFIFDDSFSALDYGTERKLRNQLAKTTADSITFIVAQRIGTIRNADQIIVLDDGEVVGLGKHEDLIESCQTYQEIAYSQLSKEELA